MFESLDKKKELTQRTRFVLIACLITFIFRLLHLFLPSPSNFVILTIDAATLLGVLTIVYGLYLTLKTKKQSPWWLLILTPAFILGISSLALIGVLLALPNKTLQPTINP